MILQKTFTVYIALLFIACSSPKKEPVVIAETQSPPPPPPVTAVPANHGVEPGVSPEKSLGWLKNGNNRFIKANFRKDGRTNKDRSRIAKGQKPHAVIVSCSDSRVPPELVFDQALGEIFVVRNAGEALDSSAIGSIEYAVEHLGARLILVLGHTKCGAVKAAIETQAGTSAGSPSLDVLVSDIRSRIGQPATPSLDFALESANNARGVATDLMRRSPILQKLVAEGRVQIRSSLYHLESGTVDFH